MALCTKFSRPGGQFARVSACALSRQNSTHCVCRFFFRCEGGGLEVTVNRIRQHGTRTPRLTLARFQLLNAYQSPYQNLQQTCLAALLFTRRDPSLSVIASGMRLLSKLQSILMYDDLSPSPRRRLHGSLRSSSEEFSFSGPCVGSRIAWVLGFS